MPWPVEVQTKKSDTRKKTLSAEQTPSEDGLLSALKAVRTRLAQQEAVPAYIVFSNSVLLDMVAKKPSTMAELLQISGVGAVKAERYGEIFLREIAVYQENS